MSRTLELNCLVFGDDLNSVFTVEIQDSKNVSILKDAIKEKKSITFQHVEANTIELWKVSVHSLGASRFTPDRSDLWQVSVLADDSLQEAVRNLGLDGVKPLSSVKRLAGLYNDALPAEGHVHIVIRRPPNGVY